MRRPEDDFCCGMATDRRQSGIPLGRQREKSILETVTVKRARKAPPAGDPLLDAIAITALAKSQKADKHRDLLEPGMHYVSFTILGTIDKKKWNTAVNGILTINPDSGPVATSSTPWSDLLLAAVCSMTERERREFLKAVTAGTVPAPICGTEKAELVKAEIEPALSQYRAAHPAAKRGIVTFSPAAEQK